MEWKKHLLAEDVELFNSKRTTKVVEAHETDRQASGCADQLMYEGSDADNKPRLARVRLPQVNPRWK